MYQEKTEKNPELHKDGKDVTWKLLYALFIAMDYNIRCLKHWYTIILYMSYHKRKIALSFLYGQ